MVKKNKRLFYVIRFEDQKLARVIWAK